MGSYAEDQAIALEIWYLNLELKTKWMNEWMWVWFCFFLQVFLEYYDVGGFTSARNTLRGRKFEGNTVSTIYYPEDKYHNKDYST